MALSKDDLDAIGSITESMAIRLHKEVTGTLSVPEPLLNRWQKVIAAFTAMVALVGTLLVAGGYYYQTDAQADKAHKAILSDVHETMSDQFEKVQTQFEKVNTSQERILDRLEAHTSEDGHPVLQERVRNLERRSRSQRNAQ